MKKQLDMSSVVALQYWEQLDCPVSLRCAILARYDAWQEILLIRVDPNDYVDPSDYLRANAAVTFLKKFPFIPKGPSANDRKGAALRTYKEGEAQCFRTNERLSPWLVSPLSPDPVGRIFRKVRSRLLDWLGPCPSDAELQSYYRHGPGTTFSSSVPNPTAADKYTDCLTLTRDCVTHLFDVVPTLWGKSLAESGRDRWYEVVRGNRVTTVPKTALTDRTIGIEPTLNIYVQLGIGTAMRQRLNRRCGWNLFSAQDIHRKVARQASIDGSFCTLDLKNASDTLAKNLVRILLHDTSWLRLLEASRSSHSLLDGRWHLLEKFSSMGNGYTFELETCIFAALCSVALEESGEAGVLGHDLYVYGDDIIVPTHTYRSVVALLTFCGLTVNKEKSFASGPFRESCGGDYFLGVDVRGYYLKGRIKYDTRQVFSAHNGCSKVFKNLGVNSPWFLDWIRTHLLSDRLRSIGGSVRLGDTVLHGVPSRYRWCGQIKWVKAVTWTEPVIVPWRYFSPTVRLACSLTGSTSSLGIFSRGERRCSRLTWVSDS